MVTSTFSLIEGYLTALSTPIFLCSYVPNEITILLSLSALISDPTSEEEQLSNASISVTTDSDVVVHFHKPGNFLLSDSI